MYDYIVEGLQMLNDSLTKKVNDNFTSFLDTN